MRGAKADKGYGLIIYFSHGNGMMQSAMKFTAGSVKAGPTSCSLPLPDYLGVANSVFKRYQEISNDLNRFQKIPKEVN